MASMATMGYCSVYVVLLQTAVHQQTLEILVEDIVTIDAIGIHRYLVDTIDVVDAHRDSVNI